MALPPWTWVAVAYAATLALAAVTQPIKRRNVALPATVAYGLAAVALGSLGELLWVALAAPGALLLSGYWLSGFFFRDPQPWLERWLLRIDRSLGAERWMARLPRPVQECLEVCYAADYVVVGGGAIYAATYGVREVTAYWALVLAAELASYAPLPWLRSRPPRSVEEPGSAEGPYLRRLNTLILDNASVQANTLPSGHVSGAVAAALGVWTFDPVTGAGLMVMAGLIAVAAVAGRYHYVVDCVAGAIVAAALFSLM